MDGRISGEHLSTSDRHVEADSVPAWHLAVDPDRLPFSAPSAAEDSGLLEPQGIDLESRREEESVLRATAVVSRIALTTDHALQVQN